MTQPIIDSQTAKSTWARFFEWELGLLVVLTLVLYSCRLTDLSIRGEESRRGRIAWEMIHSGDWLVPRVQGLPRLSRPPLQYWTIATAGIFRGQVDAIAVRLPSVLATLLTVMLIYGHGRCWMSRRGAFASGAIFATFAQVLQLGRLGETEAIFTLLLSSALLVWHIGMMRSWSPVATWTIAYILAALATLAKGPQAPVYFAGGIGLYLVLSRQWRFAFSWSHAIGIVVFLGLVSAWQIPFAMALGQERVSYVYLSEVAKRFEDHAVLTFATHLISFPFEVWLGSLFPWSLFLLAYARRDVRQSLGALKMPVLFLTGCICIAFPTVWIPPEARTRYFMPLFPCFALLCGCVIEYWAINSSDATSRIRNLAVWLSLPIRFAGVTALIGLIYLGPAISFQVAKSRDAASEIAQVKGALPAGAKLYSFGVVHHLFSFLYADEVTHCPWPIDAAEVNPELEYFCIDMLNSNHKPIPFAWEEIARVNCDRNLRGKPQCEVIIGRRLTSNRELSGTAALLPTPKNSVQRVSGLEQIPRR